MRPLLDYAAIVSQPVGLEEVLAGRDSRAQRQKVLREKTGCPVITLSLNLPGAIKRTPLSSFFFDRELDWLKLILGRLGAFLEAEWIGQGVGGDEAVIAVSGLPAEALKSLTLEQELRKEASRLLDLDVQDQAGRPLKRVGRGLAPRTCLLCDQPAVVCSSRRTHPLEQLTGKVNDLLAAYAAGILADEVAGLAAEASAFELMVAPKPGLVTCRDSGSHDDMDRFTFIRSQASLIKYYRRSFLLGWEPGPGLEEKAVRLRHLGLEAEGTMEEATGGVNTHRGWIYSSGILLLAVGEYLAGVFTPPGPGSLFDFLSSRAAGIAQSLEETVQVTPHFHLLSRRLNASPCPAGVREEALGGFPSLFDLGLPVLRRALEAGDDENTAGQRTLLALLARVSDSTLLKRAGEEGAEAIRDLVGERLGSDQLVEAASGLPAAGLGHLMEELSERFTREGLSCGGVADLLAASRFLERLGRLLVTDL